MKRLLPTHRARYAAAAVLIAAGALARATDILEGGIRFNDFKMRGTSESGEPEWELHGKHAVMNGNTIDISNVDLRFFMPDRDTVRIASPRCSFNKSSMIGRSTKTIDVTGNDMHITGKGYDLLADQQKLLIRSDVTMTITTKPATGTLGNTATPVNPEAKTK